MMSIDGEVPTDAGIAIQSQVAAQMPIGASVVVEDIHALEFAVVSAYLA